MSNDQSGELSQMDEEMARFSAPSKGLDDLDVEGTTEGGFKNGLVSRPRTFAVHVVRLGGDVLRHGAITVVRHFSEAYMNSLTVAPGFKVLLVGLEQLIKISLPLQRYVLLKLVPVEATSSATRHQFLLRLLIQRALDCIEQIGEPVHDEVLLGLKALQLLVRSSRALCERVEVQCKEGARTKTQFDRFGQELLTIHFISSLICLNEPGHAAIVT